MERVSSRSRWLSHSLDAAPESTLARLIDLIPDGQAQSQVEAARRLGVSKQRIHQLVRDFGLSLKRPPLTVVMVCRECGRSFRRSLNSREGPDVSMNISFRDSTRYLQPGGDAAALGGAVPPAGSAGGDDDRLKAGGRAFPDADDISRVGMYQAWLGNHGCDSTSFCQPTRARSSAPLLT